MITHQHIDHLGLVEIIASRSGAEVAAIDVVVAVRRELRRRRRARRRVRRRADAAATGSPRTWSPRCAASRASFRGWGARGEGHPAARTTASCSSLRDRTLEVQHRPGHSPSDTLFWDAERRILICGRPPDRPHLLEPAALPAARRLRRAAAGAGHLPRVAGADPRAAGRDRAPRPRRADHRPRRADRRALRAAPAPRGEARRADRRAPADRRTSSPRSCGATSPSPRRSSPSPRSSATSTC